MAFESDSDSCLHLLINDDTPSPTWRLQAVPFSSNVLHFIGTLKAYTDVVPDFFDDVLLVDDAATWKMPEGWAWQDEVKSTKLDLGYEVEIGHFYIDYRRNVIAIGRRGNGAKICCERSEKRQKRIILPETLSCVASSRGCLEYGIILG